MNNKLKFTFNQAIPLTSDLCEFVGVVLGDGCIYAHPRTVEIQISGHRELDLEYYKGCFTALCEDLFNIKPSVRIYKTRLICRMYSKQLGLFLKKRFAMRPGPKTLTARIPDAIFYSHKDLVAACIRGLFNTDGGIGFDKRATYRRPYIRANFVSCSFDLIDQISYYLDSCSIRHTVNVREEGTQRQIQINGEKHVRLFCEKIGFSNDRHLRKLPSSWRVTI